MHRMLVTLVLTLMVSGCGLKGGLYLPESKPAAKPPAKERPASSSHLEATRARRA
ncbi:MAG: lipoprotein [Burkholderiales bacterium]|nr:lipoprotein [Burkholderiales bacterium]